jgi:NitT/TauT family transport system ATP-binding protein
MTGMDSLELPSYRDQTPEVAERFARIRQRPVVMTVEGLDKDFDSPQGRITALRGISFAVHRRELICVIGPSGCGKSTLARILAGLESPSDGRVLLDGNPIEGPGADRGMVFQGYTLFPWLTVMKNVMFGKRMKGNSRILAESEARQWLDLVGLEKFADHYPHQLSGGMKQRVAIARALANEPRVLLMDEPFAALDAQTRSFMQAYLLEIWRNVNVTIVFITHDLDEAVYLADRVIFLKAHPGRIGEIIENPVPRPRSPNQLLSPQFLAMKKQLEHLIHPPDQSKAEPAIHIRRQTKVGDDIF